MRGEGRALCCRGGERRRGEGKVMGGEYAKRERAARDGEDGRGGGIFDAGEVSPLARKR